MQTLLGIMDPNIDTVGLVSFPPYNNNVSNAVCDNNSVSDPVVINGQTLETVGAYDQKNLIYLNDVLGSDFKTSPTSPLNASSALVQHMVEDSGSTHNCIRSFGSTSYDEALKAAQAELVKDGRAGVPKVIVFMTDGEANEGSYWAGDSTHGLEPDLADPTTNFNMSPVGSSSTINPGDAQPCQSAINAATAIKAAGTTIYSIGYDLYDSTTGYAYCVHGVWGQIDKSMRLVQHRLRGLQVHGRSARAAEQGKNLQSWQTTLSQGHYQPTYPPSNPSKNATNPCTNTITGDHARSRLSPATHAADHRVAWRLLQQARGGRHYADLRCDRRRHHQGHEPARRRQLLIDGGGRAPEPKSSARRPVGGRARGQRPTVAVSVGGVPRLRAADRTADAQRRAPDA